MCHRRFDDRKGRRLRKDNPRRWNRSAWDPDAGPDPRVSGGINVLGAWIGRGQKDAREYFLGSHAMPWWAVMGSIVATETSALTFLSVPGDAYRTGFAFLQLVFGYVIGRIAVSMFLLPSYFKKELSTAYALLEERFGASARRFTSLLFMTTRVMAAAVPGRAGDPDALILDSCLTAVLTAGATAPTCFSEA